MTGPRSVVELGRDPWSGALCSCGTVTPCCPLVPGLQVTGHPCGYNCCTCAGLGGQSVRLFRPLKPHSIPGKGEWR